MQSEKEIVSPHRTEKLHVEDDLIDASAVLWEHWKTQVKQLLPGIHGHQKKTLALFVLGIMLSGSTVLQRVAESISLYGIHPAKMTSIERRFARF